jgi:YesN/AraC family two-component response regulator
MLFYARLEILRASGCRGSYFARVFGKLAGVSPKEFRQVRGQA